MRSQYIHLVQRFLRNERGNTAMMFGLCFLSLIGVSGLALDYTQALNYSTKLKIATDAAALAAATITGDAAGLSNPDLEPLQLAAAQKTFNANIGSQSYIEDVAISMTISPGSIRVTATGDVANIFGRIFGSPVTALSATADATLNLQSEKMEIAFVLDNTGSMAANNKMNLLKQAVHKFTARLQQAIKAGGDIKLALVPFDTNVKVDPVFASGRPWMRQPLSSLSGWSGCVTDRVQPYDTNAITPNLTTPDTLFDAVDGNSAIFPNAMPVSCSLRAIMPLVSNFSSYDASVDAMSPNGQTNGTIGLAWGLQTLTPGEPFGTASAFGSEYRKIIVFLIDGANTKNRWTTDAATIDQRMLLICTEIKNKGIDLYTIGLVSANMNVLTPCASNPSMAYQVTDPNKIPDLFDVISQKMVAVRLTK